MKSLKRPSSLRSAEKDYEGIKLKKIDKPMLLFDIHNTSDLPFKLSHRSSNLFSHKLMELFELKEGRLVNSEMRAAYWRLYGDKIDCPHLSGAITSLCKQGLLRRAGYACYERTSKPNPFPRLTKK